MELDRRLVLWPPKCFEKFGFIGRPVFHPGFFEAIFKNFGFAPRKVWSPAFSRTTRLRRFGRKIQTTALEILSQATSRATSPRASEAAGQCSKESLPIRT